MVPIEIAVVSTVVGKTLVCAGVVIDTFMEVLTGDIGVEALMDALTKIILDALANTSVDILEDKNTKASADLMTAFEFASKKFTC